MPRPLQCRLLWNGEHACRFGRVGADYVMCCKYHSICRTHIARRDVLVVRTLKLCLSIQTD